MNCKSAQTSIHLAVDGKLSQVHRQKLDKHLSICTNCEALLQDEIEMRRLAGQWAAELCKSSDPGLTMNNRVLSAIAGRHPGYQIDANQRGLFAFASTILIVAASIGAGFVIHVPIPNFTANLTDPVTMPNLQTQFASIAHNICVNWTFPVIDLSGTYCCAIAVLLLILNLVVYTEPVRRLMKAS